VIFPKFLSLLPRSKS